MEAVQTKTAKNQEVFNSFESLSFTEKRKAVDKAINKYEERVPSLHHIPEALRLKNPLADAPGSNRRLTGIKGTVAAYESVSDTFYSALTEEEFLTISMAQLLDVPVPKALAKRVESIIGYSVDKQFFPHIYLHEVCHARITRASILKLATMKAISQGEFTPYAGKLNAFGIFDELMARLIPSEYIGEDIDIDKLIFDLGRYLTPEDKKTALEGKPLPDLSTEESAGKYIKEQTKFGGDLEELINEILFARSKGISMIQIGLVVSGLIHDTFEKENIHWLNLEQITAIIIAIRTKTMLQPIHSPCTFKYSMFTNNKTKLQEAIIQSINDIKD